jgi:hypothetical protein
VLWQHLRLWAYGRGPSVGSRRVGRTRSLLLGLTLFVIKAYKVRFRQDINMLVSWVDDYRATEDRMRRNLALHMWSDYRLNTRPLGKMWLAQQLQIVVLAIELVALALELRGT